MPLACTVLSFSLAVVQAKSYSNRCTHQKILSTLLLYTCTWPTSNWILESSYYFYQVFLTVIGWYMYLAIQGINNAKFIHTNYVSSILLTKHKSYICTLLPAVFIQAAKLNPCDGSKTYSCNNNHRAELKSRKRDTLEIYIYKKIMQYCKLRRLDPGSYIKTH